MKVHRALYKIGKEKRHQTHQFKLVVLDDITDHNDKENPIAYPHKQETTVEDDIDNDGDGALEPNWKNCEMTFFVDDATQPLKVSLFEKEDGKDWARVGTCDVFPEQYWAIKDAQGQRSEPSIAGGIWLTCPGRTGDSCGNEFTSDSKFCRMCGLKRQHDGDNFSRQQPIQLSADFSLEGKPYDIQVFVSAIFKFKDATKQDFYPEWTGASNSLQKNKR